MSRFRRLAAAGWPGARSSRRLYALGLVALLILLALIPVVIAQSSRRPPAGLQLAVRALIEGRYDEVPALTEKLDAQDPNVAAVKARALVARGRYQEAETALRPIAQRAPSSAAALELGLLLQMLGRADGPAILGRVAAVAAVTNDPLELSRAARALEALGHFGEANSAYRDAVSLAPKDAAINTAWGELFLEKYNRPDALKSFQAALQEDQKYGPALLGSARALADDNPPQAAAFAKKALEVNPSDVGAQLFLAGHAVDAGHRDEARKVIQTALTVKDGDVVLRMHKDEAPLLQDYALSLAHRALDTLSRRYGFTPKGPILVEIFPKHDDFAVRNVGLPGMIGALGACFGRVVTMDSPRARPPGEFQWEATLWHELAHVITIQMSNQRVPRWLTEGISVYEETVARPEWGRGMDLVFAGLMNRGETLKLKDLNAAFTNPQTISIAYFQASLLVDYFVKTFGDDGLHKLLRAYGQGLETDAALKAALNTDFDGLQGGFDQAMDRRFGALRAALKGPDGAELQRASVDALRVLADKNPGSYPVHLVLGNKLREAGKVDDAIKAFEHAAALAPAATGEDSPNLQIAEMSLERKDRATAMREAGITDPGRTRPVYERIAAIDPFDADVHATLGRLAMQRDDAETAIREFRAVIALKPVDQAAAFTDLAESYFRGGRRAEARKQTLAALEIAPSYERAQDLLLKLAEARP